MHFCRSLELPKFMQFSLLCKDILELPCRTDPFISIFCWWLQLSVIYFPLPFPVKSMTCQLKGEKETGFPCMFFFSSQSNLHIDHTNHASTGCNFLHHFFCYFNISVIQVKSKVWECFYIFSKINGGSSIWTHMLPWIFFSILFTRTGLPTISLIINWRIFES